ARKNATRGPVGCLVQRASAAGGAAASGSALAPGSARPAGRALPAGAARRPARACTTTSSAYTTAATTTAAATDRRRVLAGSARLRDPRGRHALRDTWTASLPTTLPRRSGRRLQVVERLLPGRSERRRLAFAAPCRLLHVGDGAARAGRALLLLIGPTRGLDGGVGALLPRAATSLRLVRAGL